MPSRQISRRSFVSKISKFFLSFGGFSFAQRVMAQLPNTAFWRHRVAAGPTPINLTIASNTQNYIIFTAAGSPTSACAVTLTINSGVVVSSSAAYLYAIETGTFPSGSTIHIINQGYIIGQGGYGGDGGAAYGSYSTATGTSPGSPGGPALSLQFPVTITNSAGYIYSGGGGGGGAGGSISQSGLGLRFSGGGGGGGAGYGYPGAVNGGSGNLSSGGAGGMGQYGVGGNGGGRGASGNPGGSGGSTSGHRQGEAGGGAAPAITRNGNSITWVSGSARVYGGIA